MQAAEDELSTLTETVASHLDAAESVANEAFNQLANAIQTADFNFDSLERRAQAVVDPAERECAELELQNTETVKVLQLKKEAFNKKLEKAGTTVQMQALRFSRNNNIALIAAK